MRERLYKKIISLHKEKRPISVKGTVKLLIEMSKDPVEAAEVVDRFYRAEVMRGGYQYDTTD